PCRPATPSSTSTCPTSRASTAAGWGGSFPASNAARGPACPRGPARASSSDHQEPSAPMTEPTDIATLPDLLLRQARSLPDQHLVRWGGTALTYAEFDARTDKLAAGLAELGVAPGDVVSIYLPNCLEFLEA